MTSFPTFVRTASPSGETRYSLGEPLVDLYLELEARMTADFVESGSSGAIDREHLIAIIFGTGPGV